MTDVSITPLKIRITRRSSGRRKSTAAAYLGVNSSKATDVRRENLLALVKKRGGVSKLTRLMNWSNDGLVLQLAGPNPTAVVTEKTARKI